MNYFHNKRFLVTLGIVTLLGIVIFLVSVLGSNGAVNPNRDKNLTAEEGRDFAALYQHGELYNAVEGNEDVMSQIRADIMTFARVTRSEFSDKETLVGFTFDKKSSKDGDAYVYTGHYYGPKDKIQITLTPYGRGVYTLSITNLVDSTNIDEYLSMNGKRNQFIRNLPVENDYYSVRYQLPYDRVVVSFYDGYTSANVDEVTNLITEALGGTNSGDVVYSINRIGIVSLEQVRQNLVNPMPLP